MYARISSYELPEDNRDDGIRAFGDALREISDADGFVGGKFLVSCDGDRAMTVTFWESREAMEASRVKASRLRSEAAREADGGVVSSEEFEIAFDLSQNRARS
jgi:heme-degrading monooxygenase HmoA